jgi:hypothetical protein
MTESPASVIGTWDLTIKTPIGTQLVVLQLSDVDGVVEGVAAGAHESVPIRDLVITGDTMAWQQSITKPIRLNLTFEVDVIGDQLSGTSKAGRLPRSKVTGIRRS